MWAREASLMLFSFIICAYCTVVMRIPPGDQDRVGNVRQFKTSLNKGEGGGGDERISISAKFVQPHK